MPKKKISQFTNKLPATADLFLYEDSSTGIYYNVTKNQLKTQFLGDWEDLTNTISGDTHTLAHTYTRGQGFYMNGQRLFVGGSIVSIVGTLVTFDQDYTGEKFTETGFY